MAEKKTLTSIGKLHSMRYEVPNYDNLNNPAVVLLLIGHGLHNPAVGCFEAVMNARKQREPTTGKRIRADRK